MLCVIIEYTVGLLSQTSSDLFGNMF
ncbi:hypothetical protein AX774_g1709, partial [Zancudomyces culisetae]